MDFIRRLVTFIRVSSCYTGLVGTSFAIANRFGRWLNVRILNHWHKRVFDAQFDTLYRVNTSGTIPASNLDIEQSRRSQAVQYQPTASLMLGVTLRRLGIDYRAYTFVDYGSGKGRALLMAATVPFRAVRGVELSASLWQSSLNNIARCDRSRLQCRDIEVVRTDAARFVLPSGPLVVYLFQPFQSSLFDSVLSRIRESYLEDPRRMFIIYSHPGFPNMMANSSFFLPNPLSESRRDWEVYTAPWPAVSAARENQCLNADRYTPRLAAFHYRVSS